jgi:hypothetical protein
MSAQRPGLPGTSPYWLSGTAAGIPAHAYLQYLGEIGGVQPEMYNALLGAPPAEDGATFPIMPGNGPGASLSPQFINALLRGMR